jgi:hypothetical protein
VKVQTLLRDPLVHFVLAGSALVFAHHVYRNTPHADQQIITVDRDVLTKYVQHRRRGSGVSSAADFIDSLAPGDLNELIGRYVREEALYREAKALHLDSSDYVIRLRLVQQAEFVAQGFASAGVELTQAQVEQFYEQDRSRYWIEPTVTFAHVFFSSEVRGADAADKLARAELHTLNSKHLRFEQAQSHGERFLYGPSYVEREPDEIASQFGADMQEQLFTIQPDADHWAGPFRSPFGSHLVLVMSRRAGHVPPFEAVRARAEQDAREAYSNARFNESIAAIVEAYDVQVDERAFAALAPAMTR